VVKAPRDHSESPFHFVSSFNKTRGHIKCAHPTRLAVLHHPDGLPLELLGVGLVGLTFAGHLGHSLGDIVAF
jgi:hypothetical protein